MKIPFPTILAVITAAIISLQPAAATAATVNLAASRDNTLYENPTGALSNGAGSYFFAGRTGQFSGNLRRALLGFDLSIDVPPGSTVTSVSLTLHMSRTIVGPTDVRLHRATADWGEGSSNAAREEGDGAPAAAGDATWIHASFPAQSWTTPGGDFAPAASGTQSVDGEGFYTWNSTPALVADVQGWVDNPASNFGWFLFGDESGGITAKRFDSRENTGAAARPSLQVEYEPVPEPSAILLFGVFLLLAVGCRRRETS